MKKITIFGTAALSASLVLAACGSDDSEEASGSDGSEEAGSEFNLKEEGQLTFASSGLYKPFNYEEGGELKGFDVEIGKAIAEQMGLEPNPITTPWETILQGLTGERFDAIIGSMAITNERAEQVDFSDPYYYSGGMIFVAEGNDEITSAEDLEGKKIGVVAQSTYDEAAQEYTEDIQYYNSDVVALNDLEIEGRLDAVITADVVGYEAMASGLGVKDVGEPLWIEQAAIAVNKDNPELLEAINEALAEIQEDGTYDEISTNLFDRNLLDVDLEGIEILE
ncbi:transporter substrate-binding domain-containing protein [Jeotgalibacillus sp. ET6]|uniref:transporter substrate-binding domain-containing protein n=1 Tax=Jeotgalibacillus sp. ET6 TaxID=3037260 RepID=UPI0024184DC8|nr:transporter substrate-binding domain-containing protein [Jeotgalibacillus sp. ET6]MDG5472181.1 transporter substrate-binding domain-containing protein [Jeotgalibacillus sp. ET6]